MAETAPAPPPPPDPSAGGMTAAKVSALVQKRIYAAPAIPRHL